MVSQFPSSTYLTSVTLIKLIFYLFIFLADLITFLDQYFHGSLSIPSLILNPAKLDSLLLTLIDFPPIAVRPESLRREFSGLCVLIMSNERLWPCLHLKKKENPPKFMVSFIKWWCYGNFEYFGMNKSMTFAACLSQYSYFS